MFFYRVLKFRALLDFAGYSINTLSFYIRTNQTLITLKSTQVWPWTFMLAIVMFVWTYYALNAIWKLGASFSSYPFVVILSSKHLFMLVFRPGEQGSPFAADFCPWRQSTVGLLRKNIRPVAHVTSNTVISMRDGSAMHFVSSIFRLVSSHNVQNNTFVD